MSVFAPLPTLAGGRAGAVSRTIDWDVLCALESLSGRGALRGAEWSTVLEVAEYTGAQVDTVHTALNDAVAAGRAEEHVDWRGCFRITAPGRAEVERELFGQD